MGRAINKAVTLAEILKRRIEGLHQNISLSSSYVKDVWEPLEEGLERLEMVRHVSMMSITLSAKELDVSSAGYQSPTLTKQVQPLTESNQGGGYGGPGRAYNRGRGLERRNVRPSNGYHNAGDENWNPGRGEYRGRGGGYDAGGRNFSRGYTQQVDTRAFNRGFVKNNSQADTRGYNKGYSQADNRGYNNTFSQGDRQVQNNFYPPAVTRRYPGGSSQVNIRRPSQPLADANGYNRPGRLPHQYNNGYAQGRHDNPVGDRNTSFQGRGGGAIGGRGRGRGRFG